MFNRDEAIKLTDPEELYPKQKDPNPNESINSINRSNTRNEKLSKKRPDALVFTIRKQVNAMVEPYIFLTPFEMIDIIFTIQLRDFVMKGSNQEDLVTVVFNFMDKYYSEQ